MSNKKEVAVVDPTPMQLISQVVDNPDFDVEKLAKMMDLQERYEDRQASKALAAEIASFQKDCPSIARTKKGNHDIAYAPFDVVLKTIQPVLAANSLSVRFSTEFLDSGYIKAICTVSHADGHSEDSEITIPVDTDMRANSSQRMGSANSYAKRYCLANALNLAYEEDTDAEDLYERVTEEQIANIEALLDETKANKTKFLKFAGAKKIEDINQEYYSNCIKTLERKRAGS